MGDPLKCNRLSLDPRMSSFMTFRLNQGRLVYGQYPALPIRGNLYPKALNMRQGDNEVFSTVGGVIISLLFSRDT